MTLTESFAERNRSSTDRIRDLVACLSDEQLQSPVGEHWTVAIALAHLAFWDRRVMLLLEDLEPHGKLLAPPIDDAVNDVSLPFWAAIPPREAARMALVTAQALDERLAGLPPARIQEIRALEERWVERSLHRGEHLDEIEAAVNR